MASFTIGELSREAGVKVTTIRYYERVGLMLEPERSAGGRRLYGREEVVRLAFIRHSRNLGFPLDAIRALMKLQANPAASCDEVDSAAKEQLELVRERLDRLRSLERELERIVSSCSGGEVADCRVMEALGDHSQCRTSKHGRIEAL